DISTLKDTESTSDLVLPPTANSTKNSVRCTITKKVYITKKQAGSMAE
ncbi:1000_t:CDS:2, partial [Funneliformis geosporum]